MDGCGNIRIRTAPHLLKIVWTLFCYTPLMWLPLSNLNTVSGNHENIFMYYVWVLPFIMSKIMTYTPTHTHTHKKKKHRSNMNTEFTVCFYSDRNSFSSILPSGPSNAKESSMSPACCYKEEKRPIKPAYSRQLQTTMALSSHRISKLTQEDSAKCNLDNEFVL